MYRDVTNVLIYHLGNNVFELSQYRLFSALFSVFHQRTMLCHINTASNIVTMQTMLEPGMNLDLDKVYVEVNLFGDLEPLEDEED